MSFSIVFSITYPTYMYTERQKKLITPSGRRSLKSTLSLRLHYVPGGHGSPVCPKRSAPWDFWSLFSLFSRFVKFSHGLPRYPWRVVGVRAAESRRLKGALRFGPRSTTDASTFPPGPSRSDRVPHVSHVLIKVWHVFHVLPRLSTYETWTPGSFGARLCPRYEEKASQAGFCWRKSMMSSFSSSKKLVTTLGLPFS